MVDLVLVDMAFPTYPVWISAACPLVICALCIMVPIFAVFYDGFMRKIA